MKIELYARWIDPEIQRQLGIAENFRRFTPRATRALLADAAVSFPGRTLGLARSGDRYLAFVSGGASLTLDLSIDEGSYTLAWWNVEEALLTTVGSVLGGRTREFSPPDTRDWVLDLYKKLR